MSSHPNSLRAYYEGSEGAFSDRERRVLQCLSGKRLTDRQIKDALGFADMNAVRPRITELINRAVLTECATEIDPVTNKHVRLVMIRPDPRQMRQADICPIGHGLGPVNIRKPLSNRRRNLLMWLDAGWPIEWKESEGYWLGTRTDWRRGNRKKFYDANVVTMINMGLIGVLEKHGNQSLVICPKGIAALRAEGINIQHHASTGR